MKILQAIQHDGDMLYIITDNPDEDIKIFKEKYENNSSAIHLWCDEPQLGTYKFLWIDYKSIVLWFDKEDDIARESAIKFESLIK